MYLEDKKFINAETLELFCNTNESLLKKEVKGIVLEFPGLGGSSCLGGSIERGAYVGDYAQALADNGLILVYIFPGPWSWMNRGAVRITDLIVEAVKEKYSLDSDAPIVCTGGSMGGLGALIYSAKTKNKISACAAACPCYDVLKTYREVDNKDFHRTYVVAVASYDAPLEAGLREISPIERISDMPHIPYFIVCDEEDECFDADGMDQYVNRLREAVNSEVIYHRLPGLKHGYFTPEVRSALTQFVIDHAKRD